MAMTGSPGAMAPESPSSSTASPVTPETFNSAKSLSVSEATIRAASLLESWKVTLTVDAPLTTPRTTWALVRISPVLPMTMPVPSAVTRLAPLGSRNGLDCVVVAFTETTAGSEVARRPLISVGWSETAPPVVTYCLTTVAFPQPLNRATSSDDPAPASAATRPSPSSWRKPNENRFARRLGPRAARPCVSAPAGGFVDGGGTAAAPAGAPYGASPSASRGMTAGTAGDSRSVMLTVCGRPGRRSRAKGPGGPAGRDPRRSVMLSHDLYVEPVPDHHGLHRKHLPVPDGRTDAGRGRGRGAAGRRRGRFGRDHRL